jgi:hypothetical protein
MYGPLIALFITIPIFLIALFFAIVPFKMYRHYDGKCIYFDAYGYPRDYDAYPRDVAQIESKEELDRLNALYKKKKFWHFLWEGGCFFGTIAILSGIVLFVFLMLSILNPIIARTEIIEWNEFATIAEATLDSASETDRYAVVSKILEYNEWVAKARADQIFWGNWSQYYGFEIPEPLMLK